MTEISIIVEYETADGSEDAFLPLLLEHARKTLEEEPGCLRFEVLKPMERNGDPIANKVMVSEIYASEMALTAHEANPRLSRVRAALGPLLKSRRLILAKSLVAHVREEGIRPENLNAANDD